MSSQTPSKTTDWIVLNNRGEQIKIQPVRGQFMIEKEYSKPKRVPFKDQNRQQRVTIPTEVWDELKTKNGDTLLWVTFARVHWQGTKENLEKALTDGELDVEGD